MSGFFRPLWHTTAPSAEKPFRDQLLSIERLEERALALAASFTIDPSPRRRARNIFPRFDDNARVLRDAYRTLANDVRTGQFVTAAAEWLLDNFHLVTSEIRDIRQHLPDAYYRQLPTLAVAWHPAPRSRHSQASIHRGAAAETHVDLLRTVGTQLENELSDAARRRPERVASLRRHQSDRR